MHQDGLSVGTFVVSVDVPDEAAAVERPLGHELLRRLNDRRIPATWALSRPGNSSFAEQIAQQGSDHEIALMCHRDWSSSVAGRTVFARELGRRLTAARQARLQISTLALRAADLTQNLDLLVKHRLSVIRGRLDRIGREEAGFRPQSVRFGVWHAPVSRVLPKRGWALLGNSWLWRTAIQRMCQQFGYVHLAVDLTALRQQDLRDVQLALQAADRLRQERRLTIQTMRQLSQRLIRKRTRPPTQSILRTA